MKTCLICGASCKDTDPTCPRCGEASWAISLAPPPAPVVEQPKPQQHPQQQGRKGSR